jgi:hypothetical protein
MLLMVAARWRKQTETCDKVTHSERAVCHGAGGLAEALFLPALGSPVGGGA